MPDVFGEDFRIFGFGGPVPQALQDCLQVPYRHLFPQQILQDLLDIPHLEEIGHHLGDHRRCLFFEALQQPADVDSTLSWMFIGVSANIDANPAGTTNDG